MWLKSFEAQGLCTSTDLEPLSLKRSVHHSRASCLIRTRHCWIFHLSHIHNSLPLCFYHLAVTINHLIHGQQDCLVVLPYKVRSQVMSPNAIVEISSTKVTPVHHASRRTSFCSACNSGEDATSKWMRDKASEGWLPRCSCRREKQAQ